MTSEWQRGFDYGTRHTRPGTLTETNELLNCFPADLEQSSNFNQGREAGIEARIKAEATCITLNRLSLGTLLTPLKRLFAPRAAFRKVLFEITEDLRKLLSQQYALRYGESLPRVARFAFPRKHSNLLPIYLNQSSISATAAGLLLVLETSPNQFVSYLDIALKTPQIESNKLLRQVKELGTKYKIFNSIEEELKRKLRVKDLHRATWLFQNGASFGDAFLIGDLLNHPSQRNIARLLNFLSSKSRAERGAIFSSYKEIWGEEFSLASTRTLKSGAQLDLSLALVGENPEREWCAKVECGLQKLPGFWPGKELIGLKPAERDELLRAYAKYYGRSLKHRIEAAFSGNERKVLRTLCEQGAVPWGMLFFLCVAHFGTDEDGLRSLLENSSPSQLHRAREEFHAVWKENAPWYERPFPRLLGSLEKRLWIETGGDTWVDLREYFVGGSDEVAELRERVERLYAHEKSGKLLKKLTFFSRECSIMDRDVVALRKFYSEQLEIDPSNPILRERFQVLVRYTELDCETFRALKHFIGNTITALVAALAAFGAAYSLTVLKLSIVDVMIDVATISIVTRFVLKILLKGRGYTAQEGVADVIFGILDGATLFTAVLFRQAIIRTGTRLLAKFGFRSGVSRLSRLVGQSKLRRYGISLASLADVRADE